ncbi:GNAT family N-acetyltransferase [Pontibacillus salicampi]|uniref:GNAT family N-acetyltransferase n=1 Tax=Pontibacillus salicampi TaxID=1449801 RepID=A0ABV6LRX4_9BACI
MDIFPLTYEELPEVSQWLAQMNDYDHHFVAWLETEQEAIHEQLAPLLTLDERMAWVARQDGEIIGFIGLLPFFQHQFARMLGPFTSSKDADMVLEELWNIVIPTIEAHLPAVKIAFYKQNEKLTRFAEAKQFYCYNIEKTLLMPKSTWKETSEDNAAIQSYVDNDYEGVEQLHPSAAFYSLDEMIHLQRYPLFHLWCYKKDDEVLGYIFFEQIEGTNEGDICFLFVKEDEQNQGIGEQLIQHTLQHAFTTYELDLVTISVRNANPGAEKLFSHIGFLEGPTIYAYEKILS